MSNTINYFKLYDYFKTTEELTSSESLRNIWRTRNLPSEFKTVVFKIIEGKFSEVSDFQVEKYTLKKLVFEEKMKPLQAVFFLDWLRREPGNAHAFMSSRRFNAPLEIDDDFRQKVKEMLKRTQPNPKESALSCLVPEDNSKQDIEVDGESALVGCMTADSMCDGQLDK